MTDNIYWVIQIFRIIFSVNICFIDQISSKFWIRSKCEWPKWFFYIFFNPFPDLSHPLRWTIVFISITKTECDNKMNNVTGNYLKHIDNDSITSQHTFWFWFYFLAYVRKDNWKYYSVRLNVPSCIHQVMQKIKSLKRSYNAVLIATAKCTAVLSF